MRIEPGQIRELRTQTGAGVMDCRRALEEALGDFVKAQALLGLKAEKTARKMYYGGGNFKLRSLTTLLEENSKLLKEVNEHRIARGYDPLPGYVHQ